MILILETKQTKINSVFIGRESEASWSLWIILSFHDFIQSEGGKKMTLLFLFLHWNIRNAYGEISVFPDPSLTLNVEVVQTCWYGSSLDKTHKDSGCLVSWNTSCSRAAPSTRILILLLTVFKVLIPNVVFMDLITEHQRLPDVRWADVAHCDWLSCFYDQWKQQESMSKRKWAASFKGLIHVQGLLKFKCESFILNLGIKINLQGPFSEMWLKAL